MFQHLGSPVSLQPGHTQEEWGWSVIPGLSIPGEAESNRATRVLLRKPSEILRLAFCCRLDPRLTGAAEYRYAWLTFPEGVPHLRLSRTYRVQNAKNAL